VLAAGAASASGGTGETDQSWNNGPN